MARPTLEFEEPIGILLKEIEALSMLPRSEQRDRDIARLEHAHRRDPRRALQAR